MFQGALRGYLLYVFFDPFLLKVPLYSLRVHFVYWAELAKHLQSGGFYAGNAAALGPKEPHNGNLAWLRTLPRVLRSSFCLSPCLLLTLAYGRKMALQVVGPVSGHLASIPVLCAHVRREEGPPTQLGVV